MIDTDSASFKVSLSETVAWCANQSLTSRVDEPAIIRDRRELVEESNRVFRRAYERLQKDWERIFKSEEWHKSRALLEEADPLSLSTLDAQLRSGALKPNFTMDGFSDDELWAKAVTEVVAERSKLLGVVSPAADAGNETQGRLLLFIPRETLRDGAAKYSSNGFFDANNVPPWDIWVSFSERSLVSWVPPVLVETAQRGIDANPEACISWLE